jgi:hypothetical protein
MDEDHEGMAAIWEQIMNKGRNLTDVFVRHIDFSAFDGYHLLN